MDELQNVTSPDNPIGVHVPEEQLKVLQQQYIDFCALGGLITEDDGRVRRMSVDEFAQLCNVSRQTLYRWKRSIPDFWDRVNKRRPQLSGARLAKVYQGLYLKAAAGDARAAALFLANHDDSFHIPSQKVEHELGNSWAALFESKRNLIEAEIIDATPGRESRPV